MTDPSAPGHRRLRRAGLALAAVVLAAGAVVLSLTFFSSRDTPSVDPVAGPGEAFADQGARVLAPGERHPVYDSAPPTSGPHVRRAVGRDGASLSDDQILTALAAGHGVVLYAGPTPPAGLRGVADGVAGPFSPALAGAGQAVVLGWRPGTRGIVALAWRHRLVVARADDPALRSFADFWLGRGSGG